MRVLLIAQLLRSIPRVVGPDNHSDVMTVVTPTYRPMLVRNYYVIERFDYIYVSLLSLLFMVFCWYKGFYHWTESDLCPFPNESGASPSIFLEGGG